MRDQTYIKTQKRFTNIYGIGAIVITIFAIIIKAYDGAIFSGIIGVLGYIGFRYCDKKESKPTVR